MIVRDAKDVAREWVLRESRSVSGFQGAYLAGSIAWLPDDAEVPASSDVDIMIVLDPPDAPRKHGKFLHRGVLLEASYLSCDELSPAERVLANYQLAGGFRTSTVIADPSGWLSGLQATVSESYAKRRWVAIRCEDAQAKVLGGFQQLDGSQPLHDQVLSWLFSAGKAPHVLLVAGLKNPTVRQRYVAVRRLLADYDRMDVYEPLLDQLGCSTMSRERVTYHLATLTRAFDAAKTVERAPFPFASDISDASRPISIDGCNDLISRGLHREAVFWIAATWSRCMKLLAYDSSGNIAPEFDRDYRELLADLGIASPADLRTRAGQVIDSLPDLWHVAQDIMAANPEIEEVTGTSRTIHSTSTMQVIP